MNLKLTKNNFVAGYLLLLALTFVIAQALQLYTGKFQLFVLTLGVWALIHTLAKRRNVSQAILILFISGITIAVLNIGVSRWINTIKVMYPLQLGMSEVMGKILMMDQWPEIMFYVIDALTQGAQKADANLIYESVFLLGLLLLMGSLLYQSILKEKHYSLFLFPLIIFVQQWFQYADKIQSNFSLYFIGFIMLAGNQTRSRIYNEAQKSAFGLKHFAARKYGTYLFVLGLTVILVSNVVSFFIPVDRINAAIGEGVPNILDMRTGYKRGSMALYTFKQSIYQPYDERLGGPVEQGENPILLRVWSDRSGAYLRGRVKSKYTGSSWVSEHHLYKNHNDYTQLTGSPLTREQSFEVTVVPEGIRTRTLFAPLGVKEVNLAKEKVFMNPDGAMYYKRDSFEKGLDVYTMRGVDYSMQIEQRAYYQALPSNYDDLVIEKAIEVTSGFDTDHEKMEAIKNWLRENYPYELSPGLPPAEVDFVSYFLFTEESGYCTYFASATAVMGRAVGIPTRYVEGFLLPDMRQPDGSYVVRADRAHAWAEAYIEGEGWRIFESTPAYSGNLYRLNSDAGLDTSTSNIQDFDDESRFTLDSKEAQLDVEIGDAVPYVQAQTKDYSNLMIQIFTFLIFVMILTGIVVIKRVQNYFNHGNNHIRAVRLIYYMEDLIEVEDDKLSPTEKLEIYFSRQVAYDATMWPHAYDIMNKINGVLYSMNSVADESLEQIQTMANQIEKDTKGRFYRLKYWLENGSKM